MYSYFHTSSLSPIPHIFSRIRISTLNPGLLTLTRLYLHPYLYLPSPGVPRKYTSSTKYHTALYLYFILVMRRGTSSDFVAYSYPELTNTRCLPYPRSSPTSKRNLKITPSASVPPPPSFVLAGNPTTGPPEGTYGTYLPPNIPLPQSTRKRKVSDLNNPFAPPSASSSSAYPDPGGLGDVMGAPAEPAPATQSAKKSRTNTPWSPAEEQRLKTMRDVGSSWSEIAKVGSDHIARARWIWECLERWH